MFKRSLKIERGEHIPVQTSGTIISFIHYHDVIIIFTVLISTCKEHFAVATHNYIMY